MGSARERLGFLARPARVAPEQRDAPARVAHVEGRRAPGALGAERAEQARVVDEGLRLVVESHAVLQQHHRGLGCQPVRDAAQCLQRVVCLGADQQLCDRRGGFARFQHGLEVLAAGG